VHGVSSWDHINSPLFRKIVHAAFDPLGVRQHFSCIREQSLLKPGGGLEDISKLVVNFSWPLILSKYFSMAPPFRYNKF
jgi:hypothetical protein